MDMQSGSSGSNYSVEEHGDKGRMRNGSPLFYELLEEMAETHDRKSHDYATNDNPFGNYHFAGKMSLLFAHSEQDAGFIGRIGEKIYRLANLESGEKSPQNESIADTEKDICVITLLWMADRRKRRMNQQWTSGKATAAQVLDLDRMTKIIHGDKLSEAVECEIIRMAEDLTNKGLTNAISYLEAVRDQRNKPEKSLSEQSVMHIIDSISGLNASDTRQMKAYFDRLVNDIESSESKGRPTNHT